MYHGVSTYVNAFVRVIGGASTTEESSAVQAEGAEGSGADFIFCRSGISFASVIRAVGKRVTMAEVTARSGNLIFRPLDSGKEVQGIAGISSATRVLSQNSAVHQA